MQHYVIKLFSDLRQVGRWFSPGTSVTSTKKTNPHDITEILLKVALGTLTLTLTLDFVCFAQSCTSIISTVTKKIIVIRIPCGICQLSCSHHLLLSGIFQKPHPRGEKTVIEK